MSIPVFFEKQIQRAIACLRTSGPIPLRLELWDGRCFDLAAAPKVLMRLHKPSALRYFVSPTLAGLGEAFVEGHIAIEGRIHDVFQAATSLVLKGGWARKVLRPSEY